MLQLYSDYRIGGRPRYTLAAEPPADCMYIPDEIRKCVVFVCYRMDGEIRFAGTAFFVTRIIDIGSWTHLVTAAHVIRNIAALENFDGKILLRVNDKNGGVQTLDTDVASWLFHPDEPEVDIAVLPFVNALRNVADIKSLTYDFSRASRYGRYWRKFV